MAVLSRMGRDRDIGRTDDVRPRVLLVGPVFPQGGGVGMVTRSLLESGLSERFELTRLDIGRTDAGSGKETTLAPINFYYFLCQGLRLFFTLLLKPPAILHQPVTDRIAFWKEAAFMLLARAFGVRVIGHVHGCMLEALLCQGQPWKKSLVRAALKIPHQLVVLTEYWRTLLLKEVSPSLNIATVPNTVDPLIGEAMERPATGTEDKGFMVLFIGSLGTRKGLLDALQAVPIVQAEVPDAEFVFAGRVELGQEKALVEAACEEAMSHGHVRFPGIVTGDEKLALFSQASIMILPSYNENLPVAVIEGMAMGLPVVTTPVAGVPDLIEDGIDGFLIQSGDHRTLADRIIRLAHDQELRRAMGQAGISKVRRQYSPQIFATRMARIYDQLLVRGPAGDTLGAPPDKPAP